MDALADWIFAGEKLASERFVDDDDGLRLQSILRGEVASLQQGNFHRPKIIWCDREDSSVRFVAFLYRVTFNWDTRLHFSARHGQGKDAGNGFRARKCRELRHQLARKLILLLIGV